MTKEYCQDLESSDSVWQQPNFFANHFKIARIFWCRRTTAIVKDLAEQCNFPFSKCFNFRLTILEKILNDDCKIFFEKSGLNGHSSKVPFFYSLIKSKQKVLKITLLAFHLLKEFDLRFGIEALLGFASKILTKNSLISSLIFLFQMAAHNGCILEKMSFAISRANVQCSRSTLVYARISSTPTWASTPRPNLTSQVVRD